MAQAKPAATWSCLKLVAQLGAGHRLEAYATLGKQAGVRV